MRIAWVASLLAAACGRTAFDPQLDAEVDADPAPVFPPFVCTAIRQPAPEILQADIAGTARRDASGLVIASASANVLDLTMTNAARQPTARVVLSTPAERVGSIADTGQRLMLVTSSGTSEVTSSTAYDGSDEQDGTTFNGTILGRDCLMRAIDSDQLMYAHGSGGNIDVRYVNADATLGIPLSRGVGPVSEVACQSADDHVHISWAETNGSCFASRYELGGSAPTFASETSHADCASIRDVLGNPTDDDGMIASTTLTGAIQVEYLSDAPTSDVSVIATSGRAPKIGFDGVRFWIAWIDTRTGADRLLVGHVTPAGVLVEAELPILPAGDEAFELVYDGARLDLIVREPAHWNILRLCP